MWRPARWAAAVLKYRRRARHRCEPPYRVAVFSMMTMSGQRLKCRVLSLINEWPEVQFIGTSYTLDKETLDYSVDPSFKVAKISGSSL